MNASMSQVWGMINGLQIVVYLPLYGLINFPPNANSFNSEIIKIATFDLVDTQKWVDPYVYGEIIEKDPFSLSFERTGIESTLMIVNISVILWMLILHAAILVGVFFPIWMLNRALGILKSRK